SEENEIAYWAAPSNGYENEYSDNEEYGYYNYNWADRDNPCKPSYYWGDNSKVSRNILASNIGIITKEGSDHSLTVAVASLITTKPMSAVDIDVYDYQN